MFLVSGDFSASDQQIINIAAAVLLGRPLAMFAVFAMVKLLFEVGSVLERARAEASV